MNKLHFRDNFKNFLYDLNNFITIYDNYIHIFNYENLVKLSTKEIIIIINNKNVLLKGENLKVKMMSKQELLINGSIFSLEFTNV